LTKAVTEDAMSWWQKLPSLTPIKGFSRFLYIWTNWDTIEAELKKRDERPKAIEDVSRQLLQLRQKAQEEEKRRLERQLAEERVKLTALAKANADAMAVVDRALATIRERHEQQELIGTNLIHCVQALSIVLYVQGNKGVELFVLERLPPLVAVELVKTKEWVAKRFREHGILPGDPRMNLGDSWGDSRDDSR
jgi:hypothetical protein